MGARLVQQALHAALSFEVSHYLCRNDRRS